METDWAVLIAVIGAVVLLEHRAIRIERAIHEVKESLESLDMFAFEMKEDNEDSWG